MKCWERLINTHSYQSWRPQPRPLHSTPGCLWSGHPGLVVLSPLVSSMDCRVPFSSPTIPPVEWKNRYGIVGVKRERAAYSSMKMDLPCSWNQPVPHHRIGITKIVPQRYWHRNKSHAILRGTEAWRCLSVPMCYLSTACNPQTHRMQFKNWQHWLHGPEVQKVYLQPSTTLQNSTLKRAGLNPESISEEAIYHGIVASTFSRYIYRAFEKLLWKPIVDASQ